MTREVKYQAYVPELNKIVDVYVLNPMNRTVYLSHQQLFGTPGDDVLMSNAEPRDEHERCVKIRQYTGLNDTNGDEIYEGDVIVDTCDRSELTQEVRWYRGGFMLHKQVHFGFASIEKYDGDSSHYKVIGNIYENAELLEREDQPDASAA